MKKFRTYLENILSADSPESSKRFIGVIGGLSLIGSMLWWHTDTLIYAVAGLVMGCFAINGIENVFKGKQE